MISLVRPRGRDQNELAAIDAMERLVRQGSIPPRELRTKSTELHGVPCKVGAQPRGSTALTLSLERLDYLRGLPYIVLNLSTTIPASADIPTSWCREDTGVREYALGPEAVPV